jgi:hypothetical protein
VTPDTSRVAPSRWCGGARARGDAIPGSLNGWSARERPALWTTC